jgi:hypothetical protein
MHVHNRRLTTRKTEACHRHINDLYFCNKAEKGYGGKKSKENHDQLKAKLNTTLQIRNRLRKFQAAQGRPVDNNTNVLALFGFETVMVSSLVQNLRQLIRLVL